MVNFISISHVFFRLFTISAAFFLIFIGCGSGENKKIIQSFESEIEGIETKIQNLNAEKEKAISALKEKNDYISKIDNLPKQEKEYVDKIGSLSKSALPISIFDFTSKIISPLCSES